MQNNGLFNEIIAFFLQVPSHFFFISKIYPDFVALMSVGWGFYMGDTDYCMGDTGYIWPCTQCTYHLIPHGVLGCVSVTNQWLLVFILCWICKGNCDLLL